jgi:hypothetical protein
MQSPECRATAATEARPESQGAGHAPQALGPRRPWLRRLAQVGAVVGLLALVAAWRWHQVSSLAFPAWVDSVHHTLLVRILLENRGIPDTWAPYLPEVPLYYHFGFHLSAALVALITGLTGTGLSDAVQLTGVMWQVVLAAGLGALSFVVLRSVSAAATAVVLVTFVSQMPAFYASWGRFTLLAGLALLIWGMTAALAGPRGSLTALVAGAAVTHYYAFTLLVGFCALVVALPGQGLRRRRVLIEAALGTALTSPWLWRVWHWTHAYARRPSNAVGADAAALAPPLWPVLGPARNHLLLGLAVAGLVFALARLRADGWHDDRRLPFIAWSLGLAALLAPWRIPPFRPDHAAIVLFIPCVVWAASALDPRQPRGTRQHPQPLTRWARMATAAAPARWAVLSALCVWGVLETSRVVSPRTVLATTADRAAIEWVASHTPTDASVLIDVAPWMGSLWRGIDGGWWITPLTGRRTILPPVAYGWGEPEMSGLIRTNAERMFQVARLSGGPYCAELTRLMVETDARLYYTRSGRPAGCSELGSLYERGGVHIYALDAAPPGAPAPPNAALRSPSLPDHVARLSPGVAQQRVRH